MCLLALATVLGCSTTPTVATRDPGQQSGVVVTFDHPENFLDIRDRMEPTPAGEERIMGTLRDYIVQRAPLYLSPGTSLHVTFVNIKLAGVFAIGGTGEHRRVLSSTPPMFRFAWSVADRSGHLVAGDRQILEEPDFMDLPSDAEEGDPYRYEKAVLDDWMRNRLRA